MKVRHLIEALKEFPMNASVELTRLVSIDVTGSAYDVRLDFPIVGLALSPENDLLLIVEHDKQLVKFGNFTPLRDVAEA